MLPHSLESGCQLPERFSCQLYLHFCIKIKFITFKCKKIIKHFCSIVFYFLVIFYHVKLMCGESQFVHKKKGGCCRDRLPARSLMNLTLVMSTISKRSKQSTFVHIEAKRIGLIPELKKIKAK